MKPTQNRETFEAGANGIPEIFQNRGFFKGMYRKGVFHLPMKPRSSWSSSGGIPEGATTLLHFPSAPDPLCVFRVARKMRPLERNLPKFPFRDQSFGHILSNCQRTRQHKDYFFVAPETVRCRGGPPGSRQKGGGWERKSFGRDIPKNPLDVPGLWGHSKSLCSFWPLD